MAVATFALNARRAAALLRCQQVREQRRRRDASRAAVDLTAAMVAEGETRAAEEAAREAGAAALSRAYGEVGGRVLDPGALATLPALERALAHEADRLASSTSAAVEATRRAGHAAEAAAAALSVESRATQRRSKLASHAQELWQKAMATAEEAEQDDQVADTWRAAR